MLELNERDLKGGIPTASQETAETNTPLQTWPARSIGSEKTPNPEQTEGHASNNAASLACRQIIAIYHLC